MCSSSSSSITLDGENAVPTETEMELVFLPDRANNTLKQQLFEGKYYNTFYKPSVLRRIKTLNLRDDDIYFPTYLRTGSNWVYEITKMLLKGKAETVPRSKARDQIEISPAEEFDNLPSPRVMCAHLRLSDAPEQLLEKKCKIIYNVRDPKDVAVSLYHLYRDVPFCDYHGEFKDFLYLFLEGKVDCNGMFDHLRDAEKFFHEHPDIPVHIMVYEDTIKNPILETQKLSDFLGVQRDDDLCKAIADKCEISKMQADKDPYSFKVDGRNVLFRKGSVGEWRNWFTAEMLEVYYRVYDEKMAGSRFYEKYANDRSG